MKAWAFAVVVSLGGGVASDQAARVAVSDISGAAGGETTVLITTREAFSLPAANMGEADRARFFLGKSFFNQNWIEAPASVSSRDGLGPLFNARSCSACHFKDGRSQPPASGLAFSTALLHISLPGRGAHGEPKPDLIYGDQIQNHALPGVPAEAEVIVNYEELPLKLDDGTVSQLRKPVYVLRALGYGALPANLLVSARVAPQMIGLGLLEAVAERDLMLLEDPEDENHDGISGHLNRVWDERQGRTLAGRFGWKAEQPSVRQQAGAAFNGDMGLTSGLFPRENQTQKEELLVKRASGGTPEVEQQVFNAVVLYSRSLAVPERRFPQDPECRAGEALFMQAGCSKCHVPTLRTAEIADLEYLGKQVIHPYTDLLLHDMGAELSDERPSFEASGSEWRTPPLWGVGLIPTVNGHRFLLHDGRARGVAEAILWHGGEAAVARGAFARMSATERLQLVRFVESL